MKKEKFFSCERYSFGSDELEISLLSYGATVHSLKYMGRETVLNFPDLQSYVDGQDYVCAAVGRFANRIGGARFMLNGREIKLSANEGENHLHGGAGAFDRRIWSAEVLGERSLRMSLISPDGDNGYPGELSAGIVYSIEGNCLRVDFEAVSDADTFYAPTIHPYFYLGGGGSALEHSMYINGSAYLETDSANIATGRILPAEGAFDFGRLRKVERDYDHCFVLDGEHACTIAAGDIRMDLYTDFPALQLYTASAMGAPLGRNAGLAVEPQFYPNSPNIPQFPDTLLKAGERFHKYASFVFNRL